VTYGDGKFVAIADYDFLGASVWTSDNGIDWAPNSFSGSFLQESAIAYGTGRWVIVSGSGSNPYYNVGAVYTSEDLLNWTLTYSSPASLSGVVFNNGKFLASRTDGAFLASSSGLSWTNPASDIGIVGSRDLEYLNGMFWALGYNELQVSTDGMAWTNRVSLTNVLLSLTYGNGRFVAGGEYRTIWTSTDGVTWTNPAPDLSVAPYVADVAVAYGNGVFVGASGYEGDILTSPDGINWTVQQLQTNASPYVSFRDVTFGNKRFVAVSENAFATSSDGTNWFFNTGNYSVQSVVSGNGIFVAVGDNTIATSTDGTNWVTQNSSSFGPLSSVAFGQGFFVAVGIVPWYNSPLQTESPIWISSDGVHWTKSSSKTPRWLTKIAFGNGTFVIAAEGGVLQSDPLVTLAIRMQSPPRLFLSGPTNRSYRIEYVDGLNRSNTWTPLLTLIPGESPFQFTDVAWTNSANRFYRAVLLP